MEKTSTCVMNSAHSQETAELLKHLRKEAYDIKHCFTQYTFQGLAVVMGVLAVILRFWGDTPFIGFLGAPAILLLVTVANIGTHKYSAANRIAGYELHLQRVSRYSDDTPGWDQSMGTIGWEEFLRAWRVFHATVYEFLYEHGNLSTPHTQGFGRRFWRRIDRVVRFWRVDRLRTSLTDSSQNTITLGSERWFDTRSHLKAGMSYYPGGYLHTLLTIIYITAFLCAIPVFFALCSAVFPLPVDGLGFARPISILIFIGASWWAFARFWHTYARRKVIEEGLLAVNGCAVLTQVIVCAHLWTLSELADSNSGAFGSYKGYSQALGRKALDFCDKISDLYGWYATVPVGNIKKLRSAAH